MRHEDHGAVVAGEAALELLDRLDVEVVGGLVENEAVDSTRGQEREAGAGALARRERRGRAEDVVGAEAELREQGASGSLLEVAEDLEQRLRSRQRGAVLPELAEDDARAEPAAAGSERKPAEQGVQQRRLAAAVRPGDGEPVAPADREVERPEPEGAALDDRVLEANGDLATARRRRERELELPRLVRLLDGLDPRELRAVRPLHVLRLLLLAALAVAAPLPLGHPALLLLDAPALGDRRLPAPVVTLAPPLALGLVVAPAAAVLRRPARPLVELDDARDHTVEEGAVVRDDDECAGMRGQRALEPGEAGEVEVVRGLVEQEHVGAGAQHGGERRPRLLPARAFARGPLLREVADCERRRSAPDAAGVGLFEAGQQPQQRRLAGAVRADKPDACPRRDDEADVPEDDLGSVRLRDSGRDERAGKARHAQRPPTTW